jgi:hypothetical protein
MAIHPQQAQVNLLREVRGVSGVTKFGGEETPQPMAVLGGNACNKGLLAAFFVFQTGSRSLGCPALEGWGRKSGY